LSETAELSPTLFSELSGSSELSGDVLIADRYRVDLELRIPEMDTPGAVAFAAHDLKKPSHLVYVLVQRPGIPYRDGVYDKLISDRTAKVLSPLHQSLIAVKSGAMAGRRLATVMDMPAGRLFPAGLIPAPLSEKELRTRIIPWIAEALDALHTKGIIHRGLTLNNIFGFADGSMVLGECFSSPPGMVLSPVHEPLECAQANPEGRGEGAAAHDMFAFGILILSLYLGRDIAAMHGSRQRGDFDRVMMARLRYGSLAALTESHEVTGLMGELLRGLLDDRAENRWTVEDVHRWLGGLAAHMKVSDERCVLVRPIAFEDRVFHDRRLLAFALSRNIPAAARFIRNGKFLHWIQNTLTEPLEPAWLEKYLDTRPAAMVGETSASADEWAVTRVCAVLDPSGPLRFKGQAVAVDGIGSALAVNMAQDRPDVLAALRELVSGEPFRTLLEILKDRNDQLYSHYKRLLDCSKYVENAALGYGFERMIYALNSTIVCCSPKLAAFHADTEERLLEALEARARDDNSGGGIMDQHIAAFVAQTGPTMEEAVRGVEKAKLKPEAYLYACLHLFGTLQKRARGVKLPYIAKLLMEPVKKSVNELHSRSFQQNVKARLERLIEAGDLLHIIKEFNLTHIRNHDNRGFRAAQNQFAALKHECRRLEKQLTPDDPGARQLGYLGSACFSLAVLLATSVYVLDHVFFK
jgi:hypothetical protein